MLKQGPREFDVLGSFWRLNCGTRRVVLSVSCLLGAFRVSLLCPSAKVLRIWSNYSIAPVARLLVTSINPSIIGAGNDKPPSQINEKWGEDLLSSVIRSQASCKFVKMGAGIQMCCSNNNDTIRVLCLAPPNRWAFTHIYFVHIYTLNLQFLAIAALFRI